MFLLHSNVEKNWQRVELMYSVVYEYFKLTKESDFRKRIVNNGSIFPYSVSDYNNMSKESSLVDMIIVWGVVALESLINYALAELQDDFELAKKSINNPNGVLRDLSISPIPKSKLATKIIALKRDPAHIIIGLADELSSTRNKIIHDKPIDYERYDDDDEEVITSYSNSETEYLPSFRHENLNEFFTKCDEIKNYITVGTVLECLEIRDFKELLS